MLVLATPSVCLSSISTVTAANKVTIPSDNIQAIEGLEPASLWSHFATLSSIPRPSKKEEAVIQYIKDFAAQHNLTWKQDSVGNLVVFHPGCGKFGPKAPPVLLQGHVDMVTEKNTATKHDFDTDPILLRRFLNDYDKKEWLGAQGTTLGADNGIGVAASMALLEIPPSNTEHEFPPLEVLFTVDEETGLTGAFDLDANALGLTAKTMLNLDTEEWGELYVGCAGGGESTLQLPLQRQVSSAEGKLVELRVEGLLGGHSGINIHEGRANAILLCAATVQAAMERIGDGIQLVSIYGGDKHNAIPREARALLMLTGGDDQRSTLEQLIQQSQAAVQEEYGLLETKLNMELVEPEEENEESCSSENMPLETASAHRLLSMMLALPHGPVKFSHAMPDLVETSNNVASLTMEDKEDGSTSAIVLCSTRSSIGSALEATRSKLAAIATLAGASVEKSSPYPGWNPNMKSPLLSMAKTLLAERLANESNEDGHVGVKAIHAGLECGLLIEKMGGDVDALSFGPTITGAHSPDEAIQIETVPPFFELVKDILAELAKK